MVTGLLSGALVGLLALGPASPPASPLGPTLASPQGDSFLSQTVLDPNPYQNTDVGEYLCPQVAALPATTDLISAVFCQITRSQYAQGQGAGLRGKAVASGSPCEQYVAAGLPGNVGTLRIWVCFEYQSYLVNRGGTTYGDTFFFNGSQQIFDSLPNRDQLLTHEANHVIQWHLFGRDYPQLYFLAGPNACTNIFEITAGLVPGGYSC